MLRLALYQPDIAQNVGTILRLGAALNAETHIIEPCGFPLSSKGLRRAGMDYVDLAKMRTHIDYDAFTQWRTAHDLRLVLLTTKTNTPYFDHDYAENDIFMVGRESAGVPEEVHNGADVRVTIPMAEGVRSLNVAVALGMVAGEAHRHIFKAGNFTG